MADKLDHFGHGPHHLSLHASNAVDREGRGLQCVICRKSDLTPDHVYACPPCRYFLDPVCATELQEKTYLFCHEDHKSTLITSPSPWPPTSPLPACNACGNVIASAVPRYSCNTCSYNIHPRCSQWPRTANVQEHPHLLCLVFPRGRNQSFNCAKCGFSDGGFWGYHCRECPGFFLHLDCNAFQPRPSARNQGGAAGLSNADVAALRTRVNSLEMQLQRGKAQAVVSNVLLGISGALTAARLVTTLPGLQHSVSSSGGDNTTDVGDQVIESSAGEYTTDVGEQVIDSSAGDTTADVGDQAIDQVMETATSVLEVVTSIFG